MLRHLKKLKPFSSLQIASDCHIEFQRPAADNEIVPASANLALLGDIGCPGIPAQARRYSEFLYQQADRFERVFLLAGNHEYYNSFGFAKDDVDGHIASVCAKRSNLFFLNRKSMLFDNNRIRVIGATLWSHVPDAKSVEPRLNDYHQIWTKESDGFGVRAISVADTNRWHQEDVQFIRHELQECEEKKQAAVVLTHHAPLLSGVSDPQYEKPDNLLRHAFGTDLAHILHSPSVRLWAFGHTHFCTNRLSAHVRLVANQYGYPHARVPGYRSDLVINL